MRCAARQNYLKGWESPKAFGNLALLIMKMIKEFKEARPEFFNFLAEKIGEHPVFWVILVGAAMKDDTDKYVSHFGCILHPAKDAADIVKAGRLCDYVVLKRWKNG